MKKQHNSDLLGLFSPRDRILLNIKQIKALSFPDEMKFLNNYLQKLGIHPQIAVSMFQIIEYANKKSSILLSDEDFRMISDTLFAVQRFLIERAGLELKLLYTYVPNVIKYNCDKWLFNEQVKVEIRKFLERIGKVSSNKTCLKIDYLTVQIKAEELSIIFTKFGSHDIWIIWNLLAILNNDYLIGEISDKFETYLPINRSLKNTFYALLNYVDALGLSPSQRLTAILKFVDVYSERE